MEEAAKHITYGELHAEVCKFANVLLKHGVKKGDRITIYLPMIPEAAVAMLACTRIGAVHSVVFGGFSPEALAGRIQVRAGGPSCLKRGPFLGWGGGAEHVASSLLPAPAALTGDAALGKELFS